MRLITFLTLAALIGLLTATTAAASTAFESPFASPPNVKHQAATPIAATTSRSASEPAIRPALAMVPPTVTPIARFYRTPRPARSGLRQFWLRLEYSGRFDQP